MAVRALAVALVAFAVMEPVTAFTHRYVMHGIGLALHRSHHRRLRLGESPQRWEANDAFPVMFASVVLIGLGIGFNIRGWDVLVPVGLGVTAYGACYAVVHDVYIHRRLPLFGGRRIASLERLATAHRVHHDRGGAPYGMLAPMVPRQSPRPVAASGSRPSHEPAEA